MNKQDLINKMANDAGITKLAAKAALQAFEHGVTEALANGDSVQMVGFGTFKPTRLAARQVPNPHDGTKTDVPARNTVRFSIGKGFKEAVNE